MPLIHHLRSYAKAFEKHFHQHDDKVQLAYIHSGCCIIATRSDSTLAVSGQLLWIPSGVEHRLEVLKNTRISVLYTQAEELPSFSDTMCTLTVDGLFVQLMRYINEAKIDNNDEIPAHYLAVVKDQLSQQTVKDDGCKATGEVDRRLLPVIQRLTLEPDIKLSLEDFAESCGASARTLNRLFQKCFGQPFRNLRQQIVMEKAQQLNRQGIAHTEIALDLGYNSLSAFSTAFNKFLRGQSAH
ncbi:AraC-like DNA-binding protein [Sinobacterium caligoides]|uniref:AraC-like DNA-binding protein n=2 Tax=Sinobacterium caligoides TaxID=933926 RepID=A0A3N2DPN7_9GAMM|nr:AraC-like DNA-binding protein [Sinobacterium caligoides]